MSCAICRTTTPLESWASTPWACCRRTRRRSTTCRPRSSTTCDPVLLPFLLDILSRFGLPGLLFRLNAGPSISVRCGQCFVSYSTGPPRYDRHCRVRRPGAGQRPGDFRQGHYQRCAAGHHQQELGAQCQLGGQYAVPLPIYLILA